MIQLAYQTYEDEISGHHGLPFWIARIRDPEIRLVVESRVDDADAALEEWDKKNKDKLKPGTTRWVVAYGGDGEVLDFGGEIRDQFFRDLTDDDRETVDERPEDGYDPAEYGDGLVES